MLIAQYGIDLDMETMFSLYGSRVEIEDRFVRRDHCPGSKGFEMSRPCSRMGEAHLLQSWIKSGRVKYILWPMCRHHSAFGSEKETCVF